jgi:hypothetical protein
MTVIRRTLSLVNLDSYLLYQVVESLRLLDSYIREWNSFRNVCDNLLYNTEDPNAVGGCGNGRVRISVVMMPFNSSNFLLG